MVSPSSSEEDLTAVYFGKVQSGAKLSGPHLLFTLSPLLKVFQKFFYRSDVAHTHYNSGIILTLFRRPIVEQNARMVARPLWRGTSNIHGFVLPTKIGYCSNINRARRFWCADNSIDFMRAQPHFNCVRYMEQRHELGKGFCIRRLFSEL